MNETNSAATLVGAISSALLTILGVDYYAVLWAFVGSILALTQVKSMHRSRAVIYLALSTLIGAATGSAVAAYLESNVKAYLILASIVGGFGSQLIVAALLQAALNHINRLGGINADRTP